MPDSVTPIRAHEAAPRRRSRRQVAADARPAQPAAVDGRAAAVDGHTEVIEVAVGSVQRRRVVEAVADGVGQGDLLAGGLAAVALLVLVYALRVNLWLAIPLAAAIYLGVVLLRPRSTPRPSDQEEMPGRAGSLPPAPADAAARFGLTAREREILPLLAQRLTDREIADRLYISPKTVANHVNSILGKLELTSRRDVAPFAERHGLLPPSTPPNPQNSDR